MPTPKLPQGAEWKTSPTPPWLSELNRLEAELHYDAAMKAVFPRGICKTEIVTEILVAECERMQNRALTLHIDRAYRPLPTEASPARDRGPNWWQKLKKVFRK
jgi:hypothetical protein